MEVQRDGSLEKGSVDLVLHQAASPIPCGPNASIDASLGGIINNSHNHNTINYIDPADASE